MQHNIHRTWFFNQPPGTIWEYLTTKELLSQWLMQNDFKPTVGHQFQFRNDEGKDCTEPGVADCEVLEVIPLQRLSYKWKQGKINQQKTVDSIVTWTLTEKDGGTELELNHNGFALLEDFASHTDGWNTGIARLLETLNTTTHAISNA